MTKIKDVIQRGAPIPADVLGIVDKDGAAATRFADGWLPDLCAEPGQRCQGHDDAEMSSYGPLTVTAVREPEPPAEPEPVDVLDLVRQYGDAKFAVGDELDGGSDEAFHGGRAKASALFARIEAEVQRLRDNRCTSFSTLIELLGAENLTEAKAAVQRLRDEAEADATGDLAVQRDEALAEAERLKRANDLLEAQRLDAWAHVHALDAAQPDPMVLTLPQVPEGATLRVAGSLRWKDLGRRGLYSCDDVDVSMRLGELLDQYGTAIIEIAPPREPRTWPKTDKPDDDDLPQTIDVDGYGRWRRSSPDGVLFTDGTSATTMGELMTWGDVTEVFDDEPGGAR